MFHLQCERHPLQGVIRSLQAMCWKVAARKYACGWRLVSSAASCFSQKPNSGVTFVILAGNLFIF